MYFKTENPAIYIGVHSHIKLIVYRFKNKKNKKKGQLKYNFSIGIKISNNLNSSQSGMHVNVDSHSKEVMTVEAIIDD